MVREDNIKDLELYSLIKKNNHLAFEQLYKKYWKRLFVYAYKVFQDEQTCEDVVQEIFINFWKSNADIENVEAYLVSAVKYQVLNQIGKLKWTKVHEEVLLEISSGFLTDEMLHLNEMKQIIDQSIETLPEKCKQVFILSRHELLSNQEIAHRLDISVRTVENHIYQALKILKRKLPVATYFLLALQYIN